MVGPHPGCKRVSLRSEIWDGFRSENKGLEFMQAREVMARSKKEEVPHRELEGGFWLNHILLTSKFLVWGVLAVTHLRH